MDRLIILSFYKMNSLGLQTMRKYIETPNIVAGKSCFYILNGPSLLHRNFQNNKMD